MKKLITRSSIILMLAFLFVSSCSFVTTDSQGTALKSMRDAYETIIKDTAWRHHSGTLTDKQLSDVMAYGGNFYRVYNVAVNAYLTNAPDTQQKILDANNSLETLKALHASYGGKK